jgi:ABC-type nitrate/sulfonate/bicarbonate transport system substrate-binding protein
MLLSIKLKVFVAFLVGYFASVPVADAQTLKVPYASLSPTYSPLWIAQEAGYFKKYQLAVQPVYISAGSVVVPAILSGQVDIANMSAAPALTAWARGADLVAVGVASNRLLHAIMTGPKISKPEELKGKRIGSDRYGSLSDLALREALRHYNLAPDRDVTIIQSGGLPERLGALKVGAVDGAILTGDTAFQAEKLGFHTVVKLSQLPIHYPSSAIIVSKAYLQSRKDVVKRFMKGWIEGIKTAKTDKNFTIRVFRTYLKTQDEEILNKTFEVYKDVHERNPSPDPKVIGFALKQLSATIPQADKLTPENFIDGSIVSELENEGFIKGLYER